MRKIIGFLMVLIILFGLTSLCYAGEMSLDGNGEIITGDVYARYVSKANQEVVVIENGSAEVTVSSGLRVSVSEAPDEAATLKVVSIPSTETAAWTWFSGCIGTQYHLLYVFDIYFEDVNGNRINASGTEITIMLNDENVIVFSVTKDGSIAKLNSVFKDGSIVFAADGSEYYVLAEKANSLLPDDSGESQSGKDNAGHVPQTGDDENIGLWLALLIWSTAILIRVFTEKREKCENNG